MDKKKRTQIAIIVLSGILLVSIAALSAVLIGRYQNDQVTGGTVVSDNIITPDAQNSENPSSKNDSSSQNDSLTTESTKEESNAELLSSTPGSAVLSGIDTSDSSDGSMQTGGNTHDAVKLELYRNHEKDNIPFQVTNMFPGDQEQKNYTLQVSYHTTATIHFKAVIRSGYEKLAEVFKLRIRLPQTGEVLYDGLMRDMPNSVITKLNVQGSATQNLTYEMTGYLDTSVGNEYKNQRLLADFSWWVENTENLESPQTGDLGIWILLIIAAASASTLLILCLLRKRRNKA